MSPKAKALEAMNEETRLDALEDISNEEALGLLEEAGGSLERMEALFAKQDAMIEEMLEAHLTKSEALGVMIDETDIDALESKSEEELMAAIVRAGGSRARTEALFTKQDNMLAEALRNAKGNGVPIRKAIRILSPVVAFAASLALVLEATGVVAIGPTQVLDTRAGAAPNDADDLRFRAFKACGLEKYNECVDLLDEAKAFDPSGDEDPAIQAIRQRAKTHHR
jgi:hypothetical protein